MLWSCYQCIMSNMKELLPNRNIGIAVAYKLSTMGTVGITEIMPMDAYMKPYKYSLKHLPWPHINIFSQQISLYQNCIRQVQMKKCSKKCKCKITHIQMM